MEKKTRVEPSEKKKRALTGKGSTEKTMKAAGTRKAAQTTRKSTATSATSTKKSAAKLKGKTKPKTSGKTKAAAKTKTKSGAKAKTSTKSTTKKIAKAKKTGSSTSTTKAKRNAASKTKSATKAKSTAKVTRKKSTKKATKVKVSTNKLLFKDFDTKWPGDSVQWTTYKSTFAPDFKAPPFVSGYDEGETERIRALLFNRYDIKTKAVPKKKKAATAKPKAKAPVKKAKLSLKDLLFQSFEWDWPREAVAPRPGSAKPAAEAPPFVIGRDKAETERIRALLFATFDLKTVSPIIEKKSAVPSPIERLATSGPVSTTADTRTEPPQRGKAARLGLLGAVLLLVLLIGVSYSNSKKYFLKRVQGAVEVWKGRFAPLGSEMVLVLNGLHTELPTDETLTEDQVRPIVFNYFQEKADTLLWAPQGPDFAKIRNYLIKGTEYAPSPKSRERFEKRLKGIDYLVALHRADVAMLGGTREKLDEARNYLDRAALYATEAYERELLTQRKKQVDAAIESLSVEK